MTEQAHIQADSASSQADPQDLAERVAAAMFARDNASQALGMVIDAVGPGYARLSMQIRKDMVNGHDICHGGLIFTLADSAFAFACNSDNHNTVASGANIDFVRPGFLGDRLTAEAKERHAGGRSGVYDMTVTNQKGDLIALFRGKSARIKGTVLGGLDAS